MTKQAKTSTVLLLLLLITPCLLRAQKKELSQARTYIKSGKNLEQAERLMTDLRKDPKNRDNEKILVTWYESVRGQYLAANQRMYLKQSQDTAAFFELVRRQFGILESLDSLDARPNKKGRVELEYRDKHAQALNALRPNLFNGGTFHTRKGNWQKAFDFMECYMDCARQPLFAAYDYAHKDSRMAEAAFWATSAGHKMQNPTLTLRYAEQALADSSKAQFTLQYMCKAHQWAGDEAAYVKTLRRGFEKFPEFYYFFPRLNDYYTAHGQYEEALAIADHVVSINDSNQLALLAKSTALLALERYEESIHVANRLLDLNDSIAEPYFNVGSAYLNMALKLDELKDREKLRDTYQKARIYMERYRLLMPEEKQKWGPALYRIYLNLNLGKQFDEIDRLLKK